MSLRDMTYEVLHMTDGNNDEYTCIATYVNSPTSLNIPLFWDPVTQVVNMSEILAYSRRVVGARNGIANRDAAAERLADVINNYMGITSYVDRCQEKTWFDDNESNCIIYYNKPAESIMYLTSLPPLHKMLFAFMQPCQTADIDSEIYSVALETFGWKMPAFKILNPEHVYKKIRDANCVATPLVIAGIQWTKQVNKTVTYTKHDSIAQICYS